MEKSAEALFRATLHDLANVLGGVRGIMELIEPGQPISPHNHERLVAVVEEGIVTLERSRHLVLATLPDAALEPGPAWREALAAELGPLGALFRCRFVLDYQGDPGHDQWPGRLLRDYVRAVTRQVLPTSRPETMAIAFGADAGGWWLRWSPVGSVPEGLLPGAGDRPADVSTRWAVQVGTVLGATLTPEGSALRVALARPESVI